MKTALMFVVAVLVADLHEAVSQRCFYALVRRDTVEIHWCPPPLVNHYGAFVERRQSGESGFTERPCFLSANCNRGPAVECICIDVVPSSGIWLYRMRMIDLDGTITFSGPIEVVVGTTAVAEEKPHTFSLQQNYPNPFNPTTRIEYAIPKTSHVSLKVFDLLGREVATLVDEVQNVGVKSLEFDATNFSSGIYFYQMRADGFVQTRKLMAIR